MRNFPIRLILSLLVVDVIVAVCNKIAELNSASSGDFYRNLLSQPALWWGFALSLVQLWLWTRILSKTKLSLAYPLTSLSYPLSMLAAQWFFSEKLSAFVWLGGLLITLGVAIASSSSQNAHIPEASATESLESCSR